VAGLWVRAELRRRWRALLALALLAGLAGGAVMGALAGARRADSAMRRLLDESNASHAYVQLPTGLDGGMDSDVGTGHTAREVIERLREDDHVVRLGLLSFAHAGPAGRELGDDFVTLIPDGAIGHTIDRARVLAGRLPAVDAPHEVAINELAATQLHLGPGDEMAFVTRTPAQLEQLVTTGVPAEDEAPAGPRMRVRVTGVIGLPADVGSADEDGPAALATPAFAKRYGSQIGQFGPVVQLRLRSGYDDVPAVARLVEELTEGNEEVFFSDNRTEVEAVDDGVRVQAAALLLCALVAAAAGLIALWQAMTRQLVQSAEDGPTLDALGLTRRQRAVAMLAVITPAIAAGTVLAVVVALVLSTQLPVGLARLAEPHPGFDLDLLVLPTTVAAWCLVLGALAGIAAWRLSATGVGTAGGTAPGLTARLATRFRSPAVTTGVRMAFDRRRGDRPVPVRPALVGAAAAIAGIGAVLTFGASLDHLLTTTDLAGYPWDMGLGGGEEPETIAAPVARAVADPAVAGVLVARIVGEVPIGRAGVQGFGIRSAKGAAGFTILEGRAPQAPDEVALGPKTLKAAGASIGGTTTSRTADGRPARFTVVGTALFPIIDSSQYAAGALFTAEGLDGLETPTGFYEALIRFRDGVDAAAERRRWESDGEFVAPVTVPAAVSNLDEASGFPTAVAGFLAVLGIAAVTHALVLAGRQWRGDLAVLRSLGMMRRQLRGASAVQATAIGVVGLVVGTPLGVAAGRAAWSVVASSLQVVERPVIPLTMLAVVPAALVVVNALAVLPGRRLARLAPAAVLRAE
jgi:hypothetical protein